MEPLLMAIGIGIALLIGAGAMYLYMNKRFEELQARFNSAIQQALVSDRAQQRKKMLEQRMGTHQRICGMITGWKQQRGWKMWRLMLAPANGGKILYLVIPFGTQTSFTAEMILATYPRKDLKDGDIVVFRAGTPAIEGEDDWDIGLRQVDLGINIVPTHILYEWIPKEFRDRRKNNKVTRFATQQRQPGISLDAAIEFEEGVQGD